VSWEETRTRLVELADDVAALLNVVEDDDEREALQTDYERRLNEALFAGSERRDARRETRTW
jgi:hypothetical protein